MSTHLVFVDLHKVYDTIPLNKLWTNIINTGVCKNYVKAVKDNNSQCNTVKVGKNIPPEFEVTKKLRQGYTLAPMIFKIYLEDVLKDRKRKYQCRTRHSSR